MKPRNTPTPAELEVLRILWDRGPSTVREVHELLERSQPVGYTTVLKVLQIMFEKELVTRDEASRAHVYSARVAAEATERRLLDDLKERAFGGSTARLVLRALSDAPASEAELSEVRALLDQFAGGHEAREGRGDGDS
jgi:BlaI family transcriptional regulator, penicillinase repressor